MLLHYLIIHSSSFCYHHNNIEAISTPGPRPSIRTLLEKYDFATLYAMSINDPDAFWGSLALDFLDWIERFDKVMDGNFKDGVIKWFTGGKLNVSGFQLA